MACSIRNDRDGMFPPMYFLGSGSLCSLGGPRLMFVAVPDSSFFQYINEIFLNNFVS